MTLLAAIAFGIAVASLGLAVASLGVATSPVPGGSDTGAAPARWRRALLARWRDNRTRGRASAGAMAVLQGTHAALRSGLPLALALRVALDGLEPDVRGPFASALRAFDLGAGLGAALRDGATRARDRRQALALDALALVAGEQLPASRGAAVIASVADRLAFEERLLAEVRARTAGLRAQIVLLALVVPALALYLVATMPGLAATLSTPLGMRVLVPAAAAFEIAGILASRAIVRGVAT